LVAIRSTRSEPLQPGGFWIAWAEVAPAPKATPATEDSFTKSRLVSFSPMDVLRLFPSPANCGIPKLDGIQGSNEETHPHDEVLQTISQCSHFGNTNSPAMTFAGRRLSLGGIQIGCHEVSELPNTLAHEISAALPLQE